MQRNARNPITALAGLALTTTLVVSIAGLAAASDRTPKSSERTLEATSVLFADDSESKKALESPRLLAQAPESESGDGKLTPRYEPREPLKKPWYNSAYIFGMTRGVTGSTMHPAVKAPLLILTIPLDFVVLPFAAIGGLFG